MMRRKQHNAPRGTTMIEVIVALSVVTLGIIGAFNLSLESHSTVGFSKEEIIAANLAREAIDIVRNMRDNNWLQGALWDQLLSRMFRTISIASHSAPCNQLLSRMFRPFRCVRRRDVAFICKG